MGERRTAFFLELIEKISGPGKKAAQAIEKLERAEKGARQAAEAESVALGKVGMAAEVAAHKVDKLVAAETRAAAAVRRARAFAGAGMASRSTPASALASVLATSRAQSGQAHAESMIGPVFDRALAGKGPQFGPVHMPHLAGASQGFVGPVHNPAFTGGGGQDFIGPRRASRGERFTSQLVGGAKDLGAWNAGMGEARDKLEGFMATFARTPIGMIGVGLGKLAGGVWDLAKSLADAALDAAKLGVALGLIAAGMFTKRVIELAAFAQKSAVALTALGHSAYEGAVQFNMARRVAKELGMGVEDVTHSFIEMRAAQFTARESETWVKLAADLQVVTGDAEGASRAIRAVTQIKAKGKVQAEELLQLSEAGLSLELVYKALEKQSGKTHEQIQKDLKTGKVTAAQGLAAIQAALMGKLHEKNAGDFAKGIANSTIGGVWEQLKNAPSNFMLDIGMKLDTSPLLRGMRVILDAFNGASGMKAVHFVQKMINGLGGLLPLVVDFAEGFSDGFGQILEALSGITGGGEMGKQAKAAGEWLATFFAKAIKFATEAVPIIGSAIESFLKGVDFNAIGEGLKKVDWGKLATDMVTIAGAVGKIMGYAAQLVTPVAKNEHATAGELVTTALGGNATMNRYDSDQYMANGGTKQFLDTFHAGGLIGDDTAKNVDNWIDENLLGRAPRWAADGTRQPEGTLKTDAAAALANSKPGVNVVVNATTQPLTKEELEKAVTKGVDKALNRVADQHMSEATP